MFVKVYICSRVIAAGYRIFYTFSTCMFTSIFYLILCMCVHDVWLSVNNLHQLHVKKYLCFLSCSSINKVLILSYHYLNVKIVILALIIRLPLQGWYGFRGVLLPFASQPDVTYIKKYDFFLQTKMHEGRILNPQPPDQHTRIKLIELHTPVKLRQKKINYKLAAINYY